MLTVILVVEVLEVANCKSHSSKATKANRNIRATFAGASDPKANWISVTFPQPTQNLSIPLLLYCG